MARPALVVVVNGDPDTLAVLEQALQRRFGADYQVLAAESAVAALEALGRLRGADEQVALLLAEQWLAGMTGVEFLCQAHGLHPAAKRVLLIPYGDVAAGVAGLQAMALGQLDHWLNTPVGPAELRLYPAVSELLGQWARATARAGAQPEWVRVVGPRWSARSHELRDLLSRNNIPHGFYDAESEAGRQLLTQAGLEVTGQPAVLLADGRVLVDPPTERLAQALGAKTQPPPAATTSPLSAPDQPAWPQRPTPPPRGYARCCWSARRSAAKPAAPP
jgi:thioredoxin reductase (NADPH)